MDVTPFRFSLSVALHDGRAGVTVAGDIDLAAAREFGDAIDRLRELDDGDVVIDMAEVTYIDSTGLHALLEAVDRLQSEDRHVGLLEPSAVVLRLLELCGVANRFVILSRSASVGPTRFTRCSAEIVLPAPVSPTGGPVTLDRPPSR